MFYIVYIQNNNAHTHWLNQHSKNEQTYQMNPFLMPANTLGTSFCLHFIVFLPIYILPCARNFHGEISLVSVCLCVCVCVCIRMFLFMLNLPFYMFYSVVKWNKVNKIECNFVQICNILIGIIYDYHIHVYFNKNEKKNENKKKCRGFFFQAIIEFK